MDYLKIEKILIILVFIFFFGGLFSGGITDNGYITGTLFILGIICFIMIRIVIEIEYK